ENAGKLSVKAAGGVKSPEDAEKMITMGVKRIGTSSAKSLVSGEKSQDGY
ncbi:MAG: deoxyribose-phosphate aldolase, partial [Kaistella sp.]